MVGASGLLERGLRALGRLLRTLVPTGVSGIRAPSSRQSGARAFLLVGQTQWGSAASGDDPFDE